MLAPNPNLMAGRLGSSVDGGGGGGVGSGSLGGGGLGVVAEVAVVAGGGLHKMLLMQVQLLVFLEKRRTQVSVVGLQLGP